VSHVEVTSAKNASIRHTFHGVPRGAQYEINVSTTVKDAISANVSVKSTPLPAPRLVSIDTEKNGSYVVFWKEVKEVGDEK